MSIQIGRLLFREAPTRSFEENWSSDGRGVTLTGILTSDPTISRARLGEMHDDVLGLPMSLVPVLLDVKSHRDGYYWVDSSKSSIIELEDQEWIQLVWEIQLTRMGADNEVDIESRFAGPINRLNDHALGGTRWHAPSVGHTSYWAASDSPGIVTRTGEDGAVKVYSGLSLGVNPRWQCPTESYGLARVRLTDLGERAGMGIDPAPAVWTLGNSLIRLTPNGSDLDISWHDGTAWSAIKKFQLTAGGSALGVPIAVSVLYNEYERVTIRCLWNRSPLGRITGDITLRRGSRFIEFLVKANSSTTLGVKRTTSEAATAATGLIRATSNDGGGDRYIIASTKTFTSDLVAGGISKPSVTRFDAMVGAEINGSAAVTGDQAAQLIMQYIGGPAEVVQAVRR